MYSVLFEIPETNFVGQKNVPTHVQGYYTHTPLQNCFSGLISVYYTYRKTVLNSVSEILPQLDSYRAYEVYSASDVT